VRRDLGDIEHIDVEAGPVRRETRNRDPMDLVDNSSSDESDLEDVDYVPKIIKNDNYIFRNDDDLLED
jgi:hypothetical protein